MSQTTENLKAAFAGESQANRKYLAFAKKAEKEGMPSVAKLFRAAAQSETVHALNHLDALNGVGTTEENLKEALGGETYEFEQMYPPMVAAAEAEGDQKAKISFANAQKVEVEHAGLYQKALDDMEGFNLDRLWVCTVCGHVHEGDEAPGNCPVCGAPAVKFLEVE